MAFAMMVYFSSNAQVELKGIAGLNFSSFSGSGVDAEAKAGYQFGAGLLFGEKFYVEPSLQIVRKSTDFINKNSDIDKIEFSQNFVKVPVHFGYHLLGAEDKPLALRIFAGPSASIAGKIQKGEDQISKDDINNILWAADAGVGLDILFLFVEASYEYALNDFFKGDTNLDAKHLGFVVNAGIHIDF